MTQQNKELLLKQKPVKVEDYNSIDPDFGKPIGKTALEAIKEIKEDNANYIKPEPKFKVGDWICNSACIVHIASIEDGMYYFDEGDGLNITFVDEVYHLWDVSKDAEDGDVLHISTTASSDTFIFKNINECKFAICYCAYDSEDGFRLGEYHHIGFADKCKPATKKQRDILFQRMHEAGYKWDSEKKELRKIEQKPADKPNLVTMLESYFKNTPKEQQDKDWEEIKRINQTGDIIEELLGCQKPTEWKQDNIKDLTEFESAMLHIGDSFFGKNAALDPNDTKVVKEQANLLLELAKPAEWSEEDERMLMIVTTTIEVAHQEGKPTEDSLSTKNIVDWLKSLRPQKQWKPTEEQVKAFEHFVRSVGESGYASPYDNNTKLLYSLLNQLKQL